MLFNESFFFLFAVLVATYRLVVRAPAGPRLLTQIDREEPAGGSLEDQRPVRQRQRTVRTMRFVQDWRWLWTECGTCMVIVCVSEGALQMVTHSFSRARHVHLALGFSKGFALMMIAATVLFQGLASAALLIPKIYLTTGAIAPSAVLAATLWIEAALFGDVADTSFCIRSLALTSTLTMLALFRFDRQARNAMAQLPTSGSLLNVESVVRRVCTDAKTGLVFPPLALVFVAWSFYFNPFWRAHGILYEWYRSRFQMGLAVASLLFLVGGQDTRAQVWLAWLGERITDRLQKLYNTIMQRKEDSLGHDGSFRSLGPKKTL